MGYGERSPQETENGAGGGHEQTTRHMRQPLTTEQEHAVIILYRQGYSSEKIAPMYGINGQTVLNIL